MKKISLLTLLFIASMLLNIRCSTNSSNDKYSASQDCNCDKTWFPHQQTPNPLDDSTSNFWKLRENTNNCMFHQFSVQKFLWLTRTMSNGHAYFQDSLEQVNIKLNIVKPNSLYPNIALVLNDTAQAGSQGSLHSNPTLSQDGKSNMVYYSKFVNTTLLNACKGFADSLSQSDSTSKRTSNNYSFPNGSLEIKVSWISQKAIPIEERNNYYRTEAVVGMDSKTAKKDTVVLLGIHIVTKVINHPEFIWATFEHKDLAANYNWAKSTPTKADNTSSTNDLLFFAKGSTSDVHSIVWLDSTNASGNIVKSLRPSPQDTVRAFSVFKYGTPRAPGNKFMTGTSQTINNGDSINYSNIEAVNKSLERHFANVTDVWKNYFYNGAIWLNTDKLNSNQQDSIIHNLFGNIDINIGSPARGSLAAKNITMETYTQVFGNPPIQTAINGNVIVQLHASDNLIGNCFGCHTGKTTIFHNDTITGISPLYFSHVFNHYLRNYKKQNQQIEKDAKLDDLKAFIIKKKK